jgi:NAD(P)-dependent dehydrogenase (short-subunit alcohol dehydrogenase family)
MQDIGVSVLSYPQRFPRRRVNGKYKPIPAIHTPLGVTLDMLAADIANAIIFLASNEAKMINGACLPVDRAWGVI